MKAARAKAIARASVLVLSALWLGWRGYRLAVGAPPDEALEDASWTESTRVRARDGRLLGERPSRDGLRGRTTPLDRVSPRLVSATIASEDRRFWAHDGVDRRALVRAVFSLVTHGRVISGASTITQQLVKRVERRGQPGPRTIAVKVREIARAENLEARLGKREILELYLNRIDYGHGLVGPESAAHGYFGVRAADLSLAQASLLAVLPRAPSALDPYRHLDRAVLRQRALLERMRDESLATREDVDRAMSEPLVFVPRGSRTLVAPHVVLANGKRQGEVRTTLDFDLQRDVEALVGAHAARLRKRRATDAAVIVVDNATGDVLAEVGSASFGDAAIAGDVDVVHARRQPGSTLKPFLYARAFERGVSPMEMLADVPTALGSYAPENFDGTFTGPVSAREALGGSLNVPAVRLARDLGADEVVATLRSAGLSLSDGAARYGLSIALGSGEVTPRELAEAYVTLARGGEHLALRERSTDPPGVPARVFEAGAAAAIAETLSDPIARVRGLRTRGPFELPFPTAVKTGTSTAYRDAWTAGYTRERTVVVWAGNADGSPTQKLTGAAGAGPLFFDVMKRAMADVAARAPLWDPALLEEAEVCPLSGHRPGPACPDHVKRMFPRGHAPAQRCTVHQFVSTATASAAPSAGPSAAASAGARPGTGAGSGASASPSAPASLRCDPRGRERAVLLPDVFGPWLAARPAGAPGADARGLPWYLASSVSGCAPL
jgi:penicillin-binding protein 1C